jgi:hypothetical protein
MGMEWNGYKGKFFMGYPQPYGYNINGNIMDLDLEQIMNSSKKCKDLDLTKNWMINQDWR